MAVTLQDILTDPALFFHEIDGDKAVFQLMTREDFARSTFLDGRIRHGGRPNFQVPLAALLAARRDTLAAASHLGWIFHVAQCGSTLLARALDLPGRSLVLREPAALRRIGVIAGAASNLDGDGEERLALVSDLLGKRWPGEAVTIVKANVPVNFVADRLMARSPGAAAVLLHFPLAQYLAAILRTEGHVRWTEGVFEEMRLADTALCSAQPPRTAAEKGAALWFAQMQVFERLLRDYPATRSLDAARLFEQPAETVAAAAQLFELPLSPGEAEAIAASELFHSYSKNPALDYDPEVRIAREAEAMRRLERELAEGHSWAVQAQARHGLADALDRPLVGDPVGLLG